MDDEERAGADRSGNPLPRISEFGAIDELRGVHFDRQSAKSGRLEYVHHSNEANGIVCFLEDALANDETRGYQCRRERHPAKPSLW